MKRDFLNERGCFETRVERKMGGGDLIKDRFKKKNDGGWRGAE